MADVEELVEAEFGGFCLLPVGKKKVKTVFGKLKSIQPFEFGEVGDWQFLRWSHTVPDSGKLLALLSGKTDLPVLLVTIEPCVWWELGVAVNGEVKQRFFHPYDLQYLTSTTDAHEHAQEKYWSDHDLDDVAGIRRDDPELAFLWDKEEERRLNKINKQAKKDRVIAKGFVGDLEATGVVLPDEIRATLLAKSDPSQLIKKFLAWQKKTIANVFTDAEIPFKKSTLRDSFEPNVWCSDQFELTGSLHKLLESIDAVEAICELPVDLKEEPLEASDARVENEEYWGEPHWPSTKYAENAYKFSNSLKLVDVDSKLKVPLTQLDLLAQTSLVIRSEGECLIGIQLPDGQQISEGDLQGAGLCTDGKTQFLYPLDGIMRERETFVDKAPKRPKSSKDVSLYDYMAWLPDGTELDVRVGCEKSDIASMRWTGVVKKGSFLVQQMREGVAVRDQLNAMKLFRETNGLTSYEFKAAKKMKRLLEVENSYSDFQEFSKPKYDGKTVTWESPFSFYATAAIFRVLFEGTTLDASADHQQEQAEDEEFWDEIEELDRRLQAGHKPKRKGRKLYDKNRIAIFEMKSAAVTASADQRIRLKELTQELESVGFSHSGNMICDVLGTGVVACFAGPEQIHAHIMIGTFLITEFWTRFENDDVLVTNWLSNESDPKRGVFFRSYPGEFSINDLYLKHLGGIKIMNKHHKTAPVVHGADLTDFAEQLHFFLHKKRKVRVGEDGMIR